MPAFHRNRGESFVNFIIRLLAIIPLLPSVVLAVAIVYSSLASPANLHEDNATIFHSLLYTIGLIIASMGLSAVFAFASATAILNPLKINKRFQKIILGISEYLRTMPPVLFAVFAVLTGAPVFLNAPPTIAVFLMLILYSYILLFSFFTLDLKKAKYENNLLAASIGLNGFPYYYRVVLPIALPSMLRNFFRVASRSAGVTSPFLFLFPFLQEGRELPPFLSIQFLQHLFEGQPSHFYALTLFFVVAGLNSAAYSFHFEMFQTRNRKALL